MSLAHIGSFSGVVTPGVNMLEIFKKNEIAENPNSILNFCDMSLRKFSMSCPAGTVVAVNGKKIPVITGIFPELGMDQINITSLVFQEAVNVNIFYMF